MAKRVWTIESATDAPGAAERNRAAVADAAHLPRAPRADIALKLMPSRVARGTLLSGMPASDPDNAAVPPDDGRTLPKAIAIGLLLAIPFWAGLAALAVWLSR